MNSHPGAWMRDAKCTNTPSEWWFPTGGGKHPKAAYDCCQTCPVRDPCLLYGLKHEPPDLRFGIYGGMSGPQRDAFIHSTEGRDWLERTKQEWEGKL